MGVEMYFETDSANFSPADVDKGTLAMLAQTAFEGQEKVLDMGCGYGVVGILAAKILGADRVIMCDISQEAVEAARLNAGLNGVPDLDIRVSNGYSGVGERDFTMILSNPPYHTDFSVAKNFIEVGFNKLALGGKMVMVTKRLDWYKNKLSTIFGGVRVAEAAGYYIFTAEKRSNFVKKKEKPKHTLSKKLQRKMDKAK